MNVLLLKYRKCEWNYGFGVHKCCGLKWIGKLVLYLVTLIASLCKLWWLEIYVKYFVVMTSAEYEVVIFVEILPRRISSTKIFMAYVNLIFATYFIFHFSINLTIILWACFCKFHDHELTWDFGSQKNNCYSENLRIWV